MANYDILVKIGGDISGLTSATTKATSSISNMGKRLTVAGAAMTGVFGAATYGMVKGIGASVSAAAKFETAWAGVTKTVDGNAKQMKALQRQILSVTKAMPQSTTEIFAVAEAAGQLGIQRKNIASFTKTMLDLGVSTNMTSDEAATALARLANITGMPQKNFDRLGATIVDLGNNFATTEKEITDMSLRLAGQGKQAGLSEHQILGLAAAMSSVGINAEAGGTAMSTVMKKIGMAVDRGGDKLTGFADLAGMSNKKFAEAWNKDAAGALDKVIHGLARSKKEGANLTAVLNGLGIKGIRESDTLLRLAGNANLLTRALSTAKNGWRNNTALLNEANKRYKTFESQLALSKKVVTEFGRAIGMPIKDVLKNLLQNINAVVIRMTKFVSAFTEAHPQAAKFAAKAVLVVTALLALGTALGAVLTAFGLFLTALGTIKTAVTAARVATLAFNASLMANPIGLIITAIVALVAGLVLFFTKTKTGQAIVTAAWNAIKTATAAVVNWILSAWQSVSNFLTAIWNGIKVGATMLWSGIVAIWKADIAIITAAWTAVSTFFSNLWSTITTIATTAWQSFSTTVMSIIQPFINIFMTTWQGVSTGLTSIWSGIKNIAQGAWNLIKNVILGPILLLIDLATGDFKGFQSHLTQIWNNIKAAGAQIWEGIKQVVSGYVKALVSLLKGLWAGAKQYVITVWNGIKAAGLAIWNGIKAAISAIAKGIVSSIKAQWNLLRSATSAIFKGIGSLASSVWKSIKSWVVNTAVSMVVGVVRKWEELKSKTMSAFVKVVSFIKNPLKKVDLVSIGVHIISGLIKGITGKARELWDKVAGIADGIKDKLASALKIHSPSRVMRDEIGKWIPAGIAVGIRGNQKQVLSAATSLGNKVQGAVEDGLSSKKLKTSAVNNVVRTIKTQQAQLKAVVTRRKNTTKKLTQLNKQLVATPKTKKTASKRSSLANQITTAKNQLAGYNAQVKAINNRIDTSQSKLKTLAIDKKQASQALGLASIQSFIKKQTNKLISIAKQRDTIVAKLKDANKKLSDLTKESKKYAEDAAKTITDYASVTNLQGTTNLKASDIDTYLQQRVKAIKTFQTNIAKLRKKGVNKNIIEDILNAGVDGGSAYAKALAGADSKTITSINKTQKSIETASKSMGTAAANAMYGAGINAAKGLIKGLESQQKALNKQADKIGASIVKAIKKKLKIHSPSRTLRDEVGQYIPLGIVEGINSKISDIQQASDRMVAAAVPDTSRLSQSISADMNGAISQSVTADVDGQGNMFDKLASRIDSLGDRLEGMAVQIDGKAAGKILRPHISEEEAKEQRRQFKAKGLSFNN